MTPTPASRLVLRPVSRPSRSDGSKEIRPPWPARKGPPVEPSLFYDPPYATPLEDAVAWQLVKYLDDAHALGNRVALPRSSTPTAPAPVGRVDFCIEANDRCVALQLVGEAGEHGEDAARLRHDAHLVARGAVDALYRLRRADLVHRLPDVLLVLARWEPALFSARGRTNLATLAAPSVRAWNPAPGTFQATIDLSADSAHALLDTAMPVPSSIHVDRLSHVHPPSWQGALNTGIA